MKPYYYVYRVGSRCPRIKHTMITDAQIEAERLSIQHPNEAFEILMCLGVVQTTKVKTFWMDGVDPDSFS